MLCGRVTGNGRTADIYVLLTQWAPRRGGTQELSRDSACAVQRERSAPLPHNSLLSRAEIPCATMDDATKDDAAQDDTKDDAAQLRMTLSGYSGTAELTHTAQRAQSHRFCRFHITNICCCFCVARGLGG